MKLVSVAPEEEGYQPGCEVTNDCVSDAVHQIPGRKSQRTDKQRLAG